MLSPDGKHSMHSSFGSGGSSHRVGGGASSGLQCDDGAQGPSGTVVSVGVVGSWGIDDTVNTACEASCVRSGLGMMDARIAIHNRRKFISAELGHVSGDVSCVITVGVAADDMTMVPLVDRRHLTSYLILSEGRPLEKRLSP